MGGLFPRWVRTEKSEFKVSEGRIASIIAQSHADDAPMPEEYMLRGARDVSPEPLRLKLQPGA
jgi:hypothetical protein